jgi:hypothetical protein
MQRWSQPMNNDRIVGTPALVVWAGIKDFDTDKTGRLAAGIYDCNSGHGSCTLLASGTTSFDQNDFGSDYGQVTVTMGAIDHTFAANRTLVVKVAPRNTSDDDLWLAYGTTTYPTRFSIS